METLPCRILGYLDPCKDCPREDDDCPYESEEASS